MGLRNTISIFRKQLPTFLHWLKSSFSQVLVLLYIEGPINLIYFMVHFHLHEKICFLFMLLIQLLLFHSLLFSSEFLSRKKSIEPLIMARFVFRNELKSSSLKLLQQWCLPAISDHQEVYVTLIFLSFSPTFLATKAPFQMLL